ncbi:hypothetical protein BMT55_02515 [Listeria newyorkensis]|uniref:Hyaluronate lyase n=1 Tax=Listeria newyorkensis TaxID=1497681 RepID=A0ABX4XR28_9LIST|nr:immunoglobulin-like domain-containing protein [Listeria newyorkensis]KGL38266.1 hypothetical protein EP58_16030 [Listeria newyorkensis]PNP94379.1 hypothetical protein BMT55_02515 [Listeria newyorkensis]WAO22789.1 polysaccharide lyase beta-sandwich domain-containing protein [Listeria newyorkensis]SQC56806.1 Hyaluronate lyase precursor [Listeria newyorkensis]
MIRKYFIAILLATALLFISTTTALAADIPKNITVAEQNRALNNWRTLLLGTKVDESDATLMNVLKNRDADLNIILKDISKNIKGIPTDSKKRYIFNGLKNWPENSKSIVTTVMNVKLMAIQYNTPGSIYYQDAVLKQQILDSLEVIYVDMYNENTQAADTGNMTDVGDETDTSNEDVTTPKNDVNDWNIFIPKQLINTVILMQKELTELAGKEKDSIDLIQCYLNAFDHFEPQSETDSTIGSGANRINKGMIIVLRGVIGLDQHKINLGAKIMERGYRTIAPGTTPSDGFYADGSFIQHKHTPYNTGGYGTDILETSASLLQLFNGTTLLNNSDSANNFQVFQNNIYLYLDKSYLPTLYKNEVLDMTRGRKITSNKDGSNEDVANKMLYNMYLISQKKDSLKNTYSNIVKSSIYESSFGPDFYKNMSLSQAQTFKTLLTNDAVSDTYSESKKNILMSTARRMINRNKDYVAGISMFSKNISAFEFIGSHNKTGFYTGTGALSLYNGDNALRGDYYPTVGMAMLPGTTSDMKLPSLEAPADNQKLFGNTESWSGGISDGLNGSATMDYSMANVTGSSLSAKKSWFFLDDRIVAMGTDINSHEGLNTQTIVENRQLTDSSSTLSVNGQEIPLAQNATKQIANASWAYLTGAKPSQNIGYIFPQLSSISAYKQKQTGDWDELDSSNNRKIVSATYAGLTIPHGANPSNASYMYMILPGSSEEETEKMATNSGVLTTNTGSVQGVLDKEQDLAIMNYRAPDEVGYGTVTNHNFNSKAYTPGSIMIRYTTTEDKQTKTITLSDPSMEADSIHFSVPKESYTAISLKSEKGTVTSAGDNWDIVVNTSGKSGESFQFVFEKEPSTLKADEYKIIDGSNRVTGTYTGPVAKIALEIDGTLQQKITPTSPTYSYFIRGINNATKEVYVISYDSAGEELHRVKVDIISTKGALTTVPYTIDLENYIQGIFSGDITKISIIINDVEKGKISVTPPNLKYYAKDLVTKLDDKVFVVGYDSLGQELDRKRVDIGATGSIEPSKFMLGQDSYVTGVYTGDLVQVELKIDAETKQRINVTNNTIKYYPYKLITNKDQVVQLIGYNSAGIPVSEVTVPIGPSGDIQTNTYTLGDSHVTGTFSGDVAKIELTVDNVAGTRINVPASGSDFQYYAKNLISASTQIVIATAYDSKGNVLAKSTVKVLNKPKILTSEINKTGYIKGSIEGDVQKIKLSVDDLEQKTTVNVQPDGTFQYYIKSIGLTASNKVKLIGLDSNNVEIISVDVKIP